MVMPWLIGARRAKELLFTGEDRILPRKASAKAWSTGWSPGRARGGDAAAGSGHRRPRPSGHLAHEAGHQPDLELAGFREALRANVDIDAVIEAAEVPERAEFNRSAPRRA